MDTINKVKSNYVSQWSRLVTTCIVLRHMIDMYKFMKMYELQNNWHSPFNDMAMTDKWCP